MVSLRCAKRSLFCAGAGSFSVVDVFLTMLLGRDSTESTLQAGTYGRRHHQKEEEEKLR